MSKKQNLILILQSFLPLIAFYACEELFGLKVAIGATVIVTIAEIIYRKGIKKEDLGGLFYFIAGTTIVFGLIDLYSTGTSFFKYEPALTNFVTGIYFAWGTAKAKPLMIEFAEKMGKLPDPLPHGFVEYIRAMSWIWVTYFIVKAFAYLWIAREEGTDTMRMMVVRTIAGNVSMFVLLGVCWLIAKPLYCWVAARTPVRQKSDP